MKIHTSDFNLKTTLESGQVFGFRKDSRGAYHGLLGGQAVRISQNKDELSIRGGRISGKTVKSYFDLNHDLALVYQILSSDEKLIPIHRALKGLRLIRQDSWQALACFIISSNNNVKRIQHIWRNLLEYFGGIPAPSQIARSHERILRQLGLGYRAPFLQRSAQFVSSNPTCLEVIREASYKEAVQRVIAFPGIGPKVADCVLLYGFHKLEAFPVDVWILRAMRKLYFNDRKVSEERVHAFGQKRWRAQAGYIQQYLFHGARSGLI